MIDGLSSLPSVRLRHTSAPLLKEREKFLKHLSVRGLCRISIRMTAAYLLHIIRIMEFTELRSVTINEIEEAGNKRDDSEEHLRVELVCAGLPSGAPTVPGRESPPALCKRPDRSVYRFFHRFQLPMCVTGKMRDTKPGTTLHLDQDFRLVIKLNR